MALIYEISHCVAQVKPAATLMEAVDDTDPKLSDPDKMKKLLEGAWDALVVQDLVPKRIRIGNKVAEDLFQELVSTWWSPQEFSPNVVMLRGTIPVDFDPVLKNDQIVID